MKGYLTVTSKNLCDSFKREKLVPLAPLSSWLIGEKPSPLGGPSEVSASRWFDDTLSAKIELDFDAKSDSRLPLWRS